MCDQTQFDEIEQILRSTLTEAWHQLEVRSACRAVALVARAGAV